jgi:hypothetical protein
VGVVVSLETRKRIAGQFAVKLGSVIYGGIGLSTAAIVVNEAVPCPIISQSSKTI